MQQVTPQGKFQRNPHQHGKKEVNEEAQQPLPERR